MAITTVDLLVAGMQSPVEFLKVGTTMKAIGIQHSMLYASGYPGASATPAPGIAGAALTTYAGQIPFTNPVSGNSYFACLEVNSTSSGQMVICDRLWHNSGIAVATLTAQTVTSTAFPARDTAGTINGAGVQVAIEVSAATGNAAAITNTTLSYTNSAGVAGRVATMASFPLTAPIGTFIPFQLATGDIGVASIQSVTLGTSYVSGTIHLVAFRTLAMIPVTVSNISGYKDYAQLGLARLYNNTVPFMVWRPTSTTAVTVHGLMSISQG